jgi:hypothetical protein
LARDMDIESHNTGKVTTSNLDLRRTHAAFIEKFCWMGYLHSLKDCPKLLQVPSLQVLGGLGFKMLPKAREGKMTKSKAMWFIFTWGLVFCVVTACTLPTRKADDPLTPTEQLLFSKAVKRGLQNSDVGIPEGTPITLEVSGLRVDRSLNGDVIHRYMKDVAAGWLGQQGLRIREEEKDATYRVNLILQSVGATRRIRFFGMPATSSALLPLATPELALWKRARHQGYVRFYFDIFEVDTGRLIRSTEPQIGSVLQTAYTALFVIRWQTTDMGLPPPIFE